MVQSEHETVQVKPLVTFFSLPPDDVTSTLMHFLALQSQKMCASESRIACCGGPCTPPPLSNSILYNFTHFRFQVCVDLKGSCTLSLILFFLIQHKRTYPHAGRKNHPELNVRLKYCHPAPGKDRFFMAKEKPETVWAGSFIQSTL